MEKKTTKIINRKIQKCKKGKKHKDNSKEDDEYTALLKKMAKKLKKKQKKSMTSTPYSTTILPEIPFTNAYEKSTDEVKNGATNSFKGESKNSISNANCLKNEKELILLKAREKKVRKIKNILENDHAVVDTEKIHNIPMKECCVLLTDAQKSFKDNSKDDDEYTESFKKIAKKLKKKQKESVPTAPHLSTILPEMPFTKAYKKPTDEVKNGATNSIIEESTNSISNANCLKNGKELTLLKAGEKKVRKIKNILENDHAVVDTEKIHNIPMKECTHSLLTDAQKLLKSEENIKIKIKRTKKIAKMDIILDESFTSSSDSDIDDFDDSDDDKTYCIKEESSDESSSYHIHSPTHHGGASSEIKSQKKSKKRKCQTTDEEYSNNCFVCNDCNASFTLKHHLITHCRRMHTGERPYKCKVCGKSFADQSNMQNHHRVHHSDEKPFKCTTCKAAFKKKDNLLVHNRTHTGEKPFKCMLCSISYTTNGNLTRHTIKSHNY